MTLATRRRPSHRAGRAWSVLGLARRYVVDRLDIVEPTTDPPLRRRRPPTSSAGPPSGARWSCRDQRAWRLVATGGSAGLGPGLLRGHVGRPTTSPSVLRILSRATRRTDRQRSSIQRVTGPADRRRAPPAPSGQAPRPHQHPGPLRPRQRLLRALPRRHDDVLVRGVPRRGTPRSRTPRRRSSTGSAALLDLRPDDRVVEIGTGWGGFAVHAARHYGCRVTTTTISAEQHEYATERVAREGLSDRVTVLHDDYRDLTGTYDKLASIEMIEAVDWREHDTFFGHCRRLLRPDGLMAPAGHRDRAASATSGPRTPRTSSRPSSSPAAACRRSRRSSARSAGSPT